MSEAPHTRAGGPLSAAENDEVLSMFARLSGSYYEVLGVPPGCDRAALRAAYFDQLDRFGTRRYEGRDMAAQGWRVEAIVREIEAAFSVLGDPDQRMRYDRLLAVRAGIAGLDAPAAPKPGADPHPKAPRASADSRIPPPLRRTAGPRTPPTMRVRDVRTPLPMMARDALGAVSPPPRPSPHESAPVHRPSAPPPPIAATRSAEGSSTPSLPPPRRPSPVPPRRSSVPPPPLVARCPTPEPPPAGLALESLARARAEQRGASAQKNLDEVEQLIERAARNDDHAEIVRLLRHALTLRPDDATYRTRLARAEESVHDASVQKLTGEARAAEKLQRWHAAGDLWAKVADHRAADAGAALHAAQTLCEAGEDFARAADYAKRAIRIAPDMIGAHVCLTRVFFKAGRTASARGALEAAMKLDPRHPDLLDLSKKLRG